MRRRSRGTTWVEQEGAKPFPLLPFPCSEIKEREDPPTAGFQAPDKAVIPRACTDFDRFVFSAYPTTCISSFQPPDKAVILSGALRRSIANRALYARSRRTPAMLVGRCSSELSGHKLQGKLKSHRLRAKPTCPGLPRRDLQFRGPCLEMFFDRAELNGEICGPFFGASDRPFPRSHKKRPEL